MTTIEEQIEAARLEHVRLTLLKNEQDMIARAIAREELGKTMTSVDGDKVNPKAQWLFALKTARATGVKIRQNVRKCCRGCIVEADLGLTAGSESPYAYTYGGQGSAATWNADGTEMHEAIERRYNSNPVVSEIYFNHGFGAGSIVANAFRMAGFEVTYDGSESSCVIVNIPSKAV